MKKILSELLADIIFFAAMILVVFAFALMLGLFACSPSTSPTTVQQDSVKVVENHHPRYENSNQYKH